MTVAELRYLIAIDALCEGENGVKLTEIAAKMGVTKVSVYRAVERLEKNGYVRRNEKNKVIMTESGTLFLEEYMVIVRFIRAHLEQNCGTPAETAYQDALGVACALSDISRGSIAACMKKIESGEKS
ncbi:MAG: helix-turn-helix domain-containing protein [Clostridia bacterium]|nr:helix-turn-helix domain-containing protein [Clostridia bacterium]